MNGIACPTVGIKPTVNLVSVASKPNPNRYNKRVEIGTIVSIKGAKTIKTKTPSVYGIVTYKRLGR